MRMWTALISRWRISPVSADPHRHRSPFTWQTPKGFFGKLRQDAEHATAGDRFRFHLKRRLRRAYRVWICLNTRCVSALGEERVVARLASLKIEARPEGDALELSAALGCRDLESEAALGRGSAGGPGPPAADSECPSLLRASTPLSLEAAPTLAEPPWRRFRYPLQHKRCSRPCHSPPEVDRTQRLRAGCGRWARRHDSPRLENNSSRLPTPRKI